MSCSSDTGGDGGQGTGSSTIDISSVADGDKIGLNTIIRTTVSNPGDVDRVEFWIDDGIGNVLYHTTSSDPFQFNLYSGVFTQGQTITIEARVYGTDGLVNSDSAAALVVDNILPSVTIGSPSLNDRVKGTVSVEATAYDDATSSLPVNRVELYVDGQLSGSDTTGTGPGPFDFEINTFDSTSFSNDDHTLTFVAVDDAGNSVAQNLVVLVDNQSPSAAITFPLAGSAVYGVVSIQASASDNDGIASVEFFSGADSLGVDSQLPYAVSWDTAVNTDGSLTVRATDIAGNVTNVAAAVTVDNLAPTAGITAPSDSSTVKGTVSIEVNATDNHAVEKIEFYVNGTLVATDTSSPYSHSWDTTALDEGGSNVSVKAYDSAGLTVEDSVSVTVDNTGPYNVQLYSPGNDSTVSGTVTLTADAVDMLGVDYVEFYYDGSNLIGTGTDVGGDKYQVSWDSTGTTNGSHSIRIVVYDLAGNFTIDESSSLKVDNNAPSLVTINSPSGGELVSGTCTVSVSASDGSGVGIDYVEVVVGSTTENAVHTGGSNYEYQWDSSTETDGSYVLVVTAHDLMGGMFSNSVNITVDNTPPSGVSIISPLNAAYLHDNQIITATATEASRVEFYIDGTLSSTDASSPYQSATWDTTAYSNGDHSLKTTAFDVAGNSASSTVTVTVDNADPAVSISSPAAGTPVKGTVTVAAGVTENSNVDRVVFTINGSDHIDTAFPYEYSWDTTGEADGSTDIDAVVYDSAGNTGTSTINVTVDNTLPTVFFGAAVPPVDAYVRDTVTLLADAVDNLTVSKVEFYIDGIHVGTDVSPGDNFTYDWDTTGFADDTVRVVEVRAYDTAGNINSGTVQRSFRVDNEHPTVSFAATLPPAGYVRDTVVLTALPDDDAGSDGVSSGIQRVEFLINSSVVHTDTTPGDGFIYNWDTTTGYTDGVTYAVEIRVFDNAVNTNVSEGNMNAVTIERNFTVDNAAPTGSFNANDPAGSSFVRDTVVFDIAAAGTFSSVSKVEFYLDGTAPGDLLATVNSPGPYNHSWDTAALVNGDTHTINVIIYDSAVDQPGADGNTVIISRSYDIDNDEPTVAFDASMPADGDYIGTNSLNVIAAVSDATSAVQRVEFYVDGTSPPGSDDMTSPYEYSWDISGYTDDTTHTIELRAYDSAIDATGADGNYNASTVVERSYKIDNTSPDTAAVASPPDGTFVSGTSCAVTASATDALSDIDYAELYVNAGYHSTDSNPGDGISFAWNTSGISDGTAVPLFVRVYDNAGNSIDSAVHSVTVDNSGPVVTIDSPSGTNVPESGNAIIVKGTVAEPHSGISTVDCSLDGFTTSTACTVNGTDYECSINSTLSAGGSGTLSVRAINTASVNTIEAKSIDVPSDLSAPETVAFDSPADASTAGASTGTNAGGAVLTLSATAADGDSGIYKVEFYYNDGSDNLIAAIYEGSGATYTCPWDSRSVDGNPKEITFFIRAYNFNNLFDDSAVNTVTIDNAMSLSADAGQVGGYLSSGIIPDAGGSDDLFIAYYQSVGLDIKIVDSSDGGDAFTVGDIRTADAVGQYNDIAVRSDGELYVSYIIDQTLMAGEDDLGYGRFWDDGGWAWHNSDILDVALTHVGRYSSIAVNADNVYISHYYGSDLHLRSSADNGTTWSDLEVDAAGDMGMYSSIAVDSSDIWYISYYDNDNDDLMVSINNSEQTVYDTGDVGQYTSIGIVEDASNRIYISCYDATRGALNVSSSFDNGSVWSSVQVDNGGSDTPGTADVGRYTSIAALDDRAGDGDDTGDDLYVSYYDVTSGSLKFARSNDGGATWVFSTIDQPSSVDVGQYSNITVAPDASDYNNDRVYIVYYDSTNSAIKVVKSINGGASW